MNKTISLSIRVPITTKARLAALASDAKVTISEVANALLANQTPAQAADLDGLAKTISTQAGQAISESEARISARLGVLEKALESVLKVLERQAQAQQKTPQPAPGVRPAPAPQPAQGRAMPLPDFMRWVMQQPLLPGEEPQQRAARLRPTYDRLAAAQAAREL